MFFPNIPAGECRVQREADVGIIDGEGIAIMNLTVGLVSLGCAKNLVDSEIILGYLQKDGFQIVHEPMEAQILIVNTCGFIGPAKEESINSILEMAQYKKTGKCQGLIVTGCLSGRYKEELLDEIPEIDGLLGTEEMDKVPLVIARILGGQRVMEFSDSFFAYDDPGVERVISTGKHSAYLKVAEGCNHTCAFCVIPKIRGPYRSRQPQAIVQEAKELAASGVKELIVIAQDTTKYGQDLVDTSLVTLLDELVQVEIPWIRVLYTYPTFFGDELIARIANHDRVVKYVDLPLQHATRSVLQRMGRPGNYESQLGLIQRIRQAVPNVYIRSSFIVGFPGETDEEFAKLLQFLQEAKLNHCGIFQYSREEDTTAASMPNQVSEEVKMKRYQRAMEVQQEVALGYQRALIGQEIEVLIEGPSPESDLVLVGRHRGQAPGVDGVVYIGNQMASPGDLVRVRIIEAHPYDLVGEIVMGEGMRS